jgi:acyl-CoA ligase (AMP-forming) (exosortase A-associated)
MAETYLLHHLLEQAAAAAPSAEAVVDLVGTRRVFDYQCLHSLSRRYMTALRQRGIERGDRVAVCLPKSAEEAAGIFAATMVGGVVVIINSLLLGQQVSHILADCSVKYLITSHAHWLKIREGVGHADSLQAVLYTDQVPHDHNGFSSATDLTCVEDDGAPPFAGSIGEDLAAILYTSGSTGKPRGVMLSHRNLLAGARIVSTYLNIGPTERILSVVPFAFDYGLNQLLTSVRHHATVVLLQFRFPYEIVQTMKAESITGFAGVPLIWSGLIHRMSGLQETTLPALRYITNTGGNVPTATVRRLRELLPTTQVFLMYGLTEAFRSTYLPPSEVDRRPNSIGKAIPETEIMVIGPDGRPVKPGETGILVHRGPTVSLGYWGKPELTREVLRPHPFIHRDQGGDTVCYSGDLVRTDEDGFIYFLGRADGMIKSQGYRISPTEIEEVLTQVSGVAQAAVIGLPAEDAGELVHAIVVAAEDKAPAKDEILRQCGLKLPTYMVPRTVEFVEGLPKTPNGKIDYKNLRVERVRQ